MCIEGENVEDARTEIQCTSNLTFPCTAKIQGYREGSEEGKHNCKFECPNYIDLEVKASFTHELKYS